MSGIFAENFNIYGGNVALTTNGRYASFSMGFGSFGADPDGVSPGVVPRFNGNCGNRRPLKVPTNKVGIGRRYWAGSLPTDTAMSPDLIYWNDAANSNIARLFLETTGAVSLYCNNTLIKTTPGPVLTANAWWQIEAMLDTVAEEFELRVEGVTKLTADSSDFAGHLPATNIFQCGFNSRQNFTGFTINSYLKDDFWWDGLGSQDNDFLGSCLVAELDPSADVDLGDWTPSTGTTAWQILDTATPGSTPYIASAPAPSDPVIMEQTNLPADITSIKFVQTVVRAAKVDGGDGNLQVSMISNGDTGNGEDRPITAAMTYWEDEFEVDPDTSAPWVPAALDLAKIQLDRTV